jgi:uncharacterized membrane protein
MMTAWFKKRAQWDNRPKVRPDMAPVDWLMETIAIVGLALMFGYAIYWYRYLPEIIPTHFSSGGKVDGYGSKSFLYFLPGIGLFVYAILSVIVLFPHTFNFPGKITPQNAMYQYRLAIRLIRFLKIAIMALFFFIMIMVVESAQNMKLGKGILLLPFSFALVFFPVIIYMVMAGRK